MRHELVRLKFHNPAISMTVDRNVPQTDPATMTVFFASSDAPQKAVPTQSTSGDKPPSDYAPTERTEEISMTNQTSGDILEELLRVTKATLVQPTQQDREDLEVLQAAKIRSEKDSKLSVEVRASKKREEAILAQARGEIASGEAI